VTPSPPRIQRLQRIDRALGPLACALLQPLRWLRAAAPRRGPVERVLLIKFWGIGSLQLMTPALRSLRERHPRAELVLLTLRENEEFARGLGLLDDVITLDVAEAPRTLVACRIARLIGGLRRRRFDAVYDFEFFTHFSAIVTLLSGARDSHGFESPTVWRGGFHRHVAPFNRYWHVARNFRVLAGGEDGRAVGPADLVPWAPGPAHALELGAALDAEGLDSGEGPLVVLNPNAGTLSLERRWPRVRFAELAARLVREEGARIALVGTLSERDWTSGVVERAGDLPAGSLVNLSGRLSFGALAALLDACDLFVTNDSGPMHIAAALATPTLGLFGPETPVMYRPIGVRARALHRPPACSPCINVHDNKVASCVRELAECLLALDVDLVMDEARAMLRRRALAVCDVPRPEPRTTPRPASGASAR
jgi:ADP-heptose:LPS heptosyltransferase